MEEGSGGRPPPGGPREGAAADQAGYFRNPVEIHGTAAMTTMPTAIEPR
jgi:hypothetical protein